MAPPAQVGGGLVLHKILNAHSLFSNLSENP